MADLGREALDTRAGDRDRGQQLGVPVARNDLGRDLFALQTERLHHACFDRRRDRGVGTDRARELADRALLDRPLEPVDVAIGFEGEAGQPQAEGGRLGVDAVGTADAERVAIVESLSDQGVAVGLRTLDQDLVRRR